MWSEDIQGSEAYARALQKTGILSGTETEAICKGLGKVKAEWAEGKFEVVVSSASETTSSCLGLATIPG